MTDSITLTGLVATDPRHIVTSEGLAITSFRLASAQRRFDKTQERWIDTETNWYTITAFRQLAINAAVSIKKGERVIVTGRVRIREWENDERKGVNIDIEADALGPDLLWGTTTFTRSISTSSSSAPAAAAVDGDADADADADADVGAGAGAGAGAGREVDAGEAHVTPEVVPELEPALPF